MKHIASKLAEFWRIVNNSNGSNITISELPYLYESEIWKEMEVADYVKVIACLFIVIGGLIGNFGVIFIVVLTKSLWKTMNVCMVNLALADAMICIFCAIPYAINVMTGDLYIFGNSMCKFTPFTQMTCLICSVLTLSAMSCDRFMSVMYPLKARARRFRTSLLLAIIWIVAILFALPLLFLKHEEIIQWKDFNETKCVEEWPQEYFHLRTPYHLATCVALFFVPAVIMITSNSLLLRKLWTARIPGEHNANNENIRYKTTRKWTIMVLIMLIVFIICWSPMIMTFLYGICGPKHTYMPQWFVHLEWFAFYMAYANSYLNPIIYGGFNAQFRRKFCSLFRCNISRKQFKDSVRSRVTYTTSILSSVSRRLSRTLSGSSTKHHSNKNEMCQAVPVSNIPGKNISSAFEGKPRLQSI